MKIEGLLKEVSRHSLVWCCREAVLKEMTPELALEGRIGTSRVKDKKEVPGRLAGVKVLGYEKALPASATISSSYGCLGNKDGKGVVMYWGNQQARDWLSGTSLKGQGRG